MSLNSDSKSKRSFKSISANPSSSSNNSGDGKKKKAQKTLGMAWGANSSSSSRPAFRNSPFANFGSYMGLKNQKLHEQFDAAASSTSHSASNSGLSIFSGVSIFVDGYTVPSSQELRGFMLKYGGRFENYFSRQRVTHIVCSNLPDSKIKNLRAFSGGLPVVKPAWVLDSVAANKLLNWIPYQLDQVAADNDNQPKLAAFFTLKTSRVSEVADLLVDGQVIPENEKQSVNAGLSENYAFLEEEDKCILELEEPACSVESSCEMKGVELTDHSDGKSSDVKPKPSTSQASVSLCSGIPDRNNISEASNSRIILPPSQRHSTLGDPNFVENYFKSSRLHFIGTWRNRYRKRFPNLSDGLRHRSPIPNSAVVNENNAIIHIDMDCFFVSVVIRNRPELLDKPVAVCHSDNPRGTSEISSANYPARDYGVKAGMFVKDAMVQCPQLVIVPYDFGAYEMVADQFYDILHKHCDNVQAVSCDEAFLDVSGSEVRDFQLLASIIRKEILDTTGCCASAGIAGNMLMARLATKTAKPNGQCYIPFEEIDNYLHALPVKALPGIGHVLETKLRQKEIATCGQLRVISKESLQADFGMKTGEMLWNYSRGIDNRLVGMIRETKSIGADVNWGVRFRNLNDARHFLMDLCKEVSLRLHGCSVQGRAFTLKIKKKRGVAGEPIKFMGHGDCENLSHTITVPMATNDVDVIKRLATQLFRYFHIDVTDIRGVGLQVSKLEGADDNKLAQKKNSILPWLVSKSEKARGRNRNGHLSNHGDADPRRLNDGEVFGQPSITRSSGEMGSLSTGLPLLQDLDMTVLESLPPEVVSEINDMYGGKLVGFISKNKNKTANANMNFTSQSSKESMPETHLVESNTIAADNLFPSSLSQVDRSVLEQLPDELRKDIMDLLPQHRELESAEHTEFATTELSELWSGSPPKWVDKFKRSNCSTLNDFAKTFQRTRSGDCLSSLLQRMMSVLFLPMEVADGDLSWLCELFKQYIDLKIGSDIEEIYLCVRLLKRLTGRSEVFLQVYNVILPHLQALMGEKYGGTLSIPC